MPNLVVLFRSVLLVGAAAFLLTLYLLWVSTVESVQRDLKHAESMLATAVQGWLQDRERLLVEEGVALLALIDAGGMQQATDLAARIRRTDTQALELVLADVDGGIVLHASGDAVGPDAEALVHLGGQVLQDVVARRGLVVGAPRSGRAAGLPFSVPLVDVEGMTRGVLTVIYRPSVFSSVLLASDLHPGIRAALVNDEGDVIVAATAPDDLSAHPASDGKGTTIVAEYGQSGISSRLGQSIESRVHYVSRRPVAGQALKVVSWVGREAVFDAYLARTSMPVLIFVIGVAAGLLLYRYAKGRQQRIEVEVKRLSAWQQAALDASSYCIISTDTKGVIATFNRTAQILLGYKPEQVIGKLTPEVIHDPNEVAAYALELSDELGERVEPGFEAFVARSRRGEVDEREWTYIHKNGTRIPVLLAVTAIRDRDQEIVGFLGIAADLSESKRVQQSLKDTESRYQALFDSAGEAIFLLNQKGSILECNPAAEKLFGYQQGDMISKRLDELSPDHQPDGSRSPDKASRHIRGSFSGGPQFFGWSCERQDGVTFDAEVSLTTVKIADMPHLLATIRDVTERKQFEQQLAYQADHDSLTGLPNRKALHAAFENFRSMLDASQRAMAMLLLDLDRFKEINDTVGHHHGDLVLAMIGPRLQAVCAERSATVARLGGDEFAVLVETNGHADDVMSLSRELLNSLRKPCVAKGIETIVDASVGIALYPEHGRDSHDLLRAADVAMYEAKRRSIGVKLYEEEIDEYSRQRLSLATELAQAVIQDQLLLHYQPKISIATGEVEGFEALVRWQHPDRGLLYPGAFMDLVEIGEVIHPFTQAVIEIAVRDKKRLHQLGYRQPVAINLSARSLRDAECVEKLDATLRRHHLPAGEVAMELTESSVMHDPERAIAILNNFKHLGVSIAIDDFGTGYSSLTYLRQLPVSALKIDRSFVIEMLTSSQDAAIVRSTIALAHSLELKTIAEGVENEQTLAFLQAMNCDQAQGYGICRPQPLEQLVDWLKAKDPAPAAFAIQ